MKCEPVSLNTFPVQFPSRPTSPRLTFIPFLSISGFLGSRKVNLKLISYKMQYSLPLAHYLLSIGLPLNVNVNLRLRGRPLPPCLLLPIYCLLLLLTINLQSVRSDSSFQNVTCGSVFKLKNIAYDVRLHSHDVKYGTGSGQQSVTGNEDNEDSNSNWVIKGPDSKHPCVRG